MKVREFLDRPFDVVVTQELLDILKKSGGWMIPVDYEIGKKLTIFVRDEIEYERVPIIREKNREDKVNQMQKPGLSFFRSTGNGNLNAILRFELPAGMGDPFLPEELKGKPWLFKFHVMVFNRRQPELAEYHEALSKIASRMQTRMDEIGVALKEMEKIK